MPTTITGTDGVSQVQAGAVESGDLASGAIGSGDLPAGSVIQVVQGIENTFLSSTSETFIDSGLSASITPSSASNKILVLLSAPIAALRQSPPATATIRILRDDIAIYTAGGRSPFINSAVGVADFVHVQSNLSFSVLDSPSTSLSLTYKLQIRTEDNSSSGEVRINDDSTTSFITLMEIAG